MIGEVIAVCDVSMCEQVMWIESTSNAKNHITRFQVFSTSGDVYVSFCSLQDS